MLEISLVHDQIDVATVTRSCYDDSCGAVTSFIGTVRNNNQGKDVLHLDFEAFEPMAVKELRKIAEEAQGRWDIQKLIVIHRLGKVSIGEEAVVIVVSTRHRKASFKSCEFIIDSLKKTVPIWKKEVYASGQTWISAHP